MAQKVNTLPGLFTVQVARSGHRNLGPISSTLDMDVSAWPARSRTGFVKCFSGIPVGVLLSLNYRSKPRILFD